MIVSGPNQSIEIRWARLKGKTENALLRMPFRTAYMFRPGYVQPSTGFGTKTK